MRRKLLNWSAVGTLGLATVAVVVRLTVRDRFSWLAPLNYAVPPSVAAAMVFAGGAIWWRLGHRRRAAGCGVGCLACLVLWHVTTYVPASRTLSSSDFAAASVRVLVWNIADGDWGFSAVVGQIRAADADLVVLGEAGRDIRDPDELKSLWGRAMPGYHVSPTRHGLVILAKAPIESCRFGVLGKRGKYQHAVVNFGGWRLNVVQPEIPSNPFRSREPMLEALRGVLEPMADEPLLVAGDFNLTGNSFWFDTWRSFLTDAFEQRGEGYYQSWPVPLPVLDLDHAWVSSRVAVRKCSLGWSWRSDHRPLQLEIAAVP